MKATITGATGHVGSTLVRVLIAHGHEVRAIVRSEGRGLIGLDVEKASADVSDPDSLNRAFHGRDVVFHAAARISISRSDTKEVVAANLGGTRNVIAACRHEGVRRLVHFSSIEAIDPRPLDSAVNEDRPFVDGSAGSPYAVSKALAEAEVRRAVSEGFDAVILNPTAIIGPNDFKPSLLGRALLAFARGSLPMLIDGGFDWVDVRDVAEAAVAAAERAPTGGRYIVGGRWASMAELAKLVCDAAGARLPRLVCPFGLARAWAPLSTGFCRLAGRAPLFTSYTLKILLGNRCVSHARAQRDLGYGPRDLEQTVRETLIWFRENGFLDTRGRGVSTVA